MNLPNRAVSRLIEIIRAWPYLRRMLYDYLGKVVVEAQEDGGPTGDIAPEFGTDLFYFSELLHPAVWTGLAGGAATLTTNSSLPVWEFNDAATYGIKILWLPPEGFDPTADALTVQVYHAPVTAPSGTDVVVDVSVEEYEEGDSLGSASWTTEEQTLTCGSAGVLCIDSFDFSTGVSAISEGDALAIRLRRLGGDASDDLGVAWQVYQVRLRYRCNSLGRYP